MANFYSELYQWVYLVLGANEGGQRDFLKSNSPWNSGKYTKFRVKNGGALDSDSHYLAGYLFYWIVKENPVGYCNIHFIIILINKPLSVLTKIIALMCNC